MESTRANLHYKIKNGAHVINHDENFDIGIHWVALYILNNKAIYFDSFGIEYIPKEIKKFIKRSTIVTNIFRIQVYESVMCGYFCIGFIDFMRKGKILTDFTNLFSPNIIFTKYNTILNYFVTNI